MRNIIFLSCLVLASATSAMEMPTLSDVFNRQIYELTVSTNASAEEILERFRANKREQLHARVVADLEKRSTDLQHERETHNAKLLKARVATIILIIPTMFFAPKAMPFVMTSGHAFSMWFAGNGINSDFHEEIKQKIACYLSAIQGEDSALLEEHYIVEKYQRPIADDLALRIEQVLLLARKPELLNFSAHDFVRDALKLPHKHKQFSDTVKLGKSNDIHEDNRRALNEIMNSVCRQSRLTGDDLNRRTCFIVFDDQNPKSDALPKRMASALNLPCVNMMLDESGPNLFGTCCFTGTPKKGELCTAFLREENMPNNAFVLIDLNHLAQVTEQPIRYIKKLLTDTQMSSEYFGCTIDIGRLNFVIHLDSVGESFRDDFLALYEEMPTIEVASFSNETKRAMLAHYANGHKLFNDVDTKSAIDLIMTQFSARKVKEQIAMLERMSTAPRKEWPELLGLSTKVKDLCSEIATLEDTCATLHATIKDLNEKLTPLMNENSRRQTNFTIVDINATALTVTLDNGIVFKYERTIDESTSLPLWKVGDEVTVSFDGWFYLTNKRHNKYLRFELHERPKSDRPSYETFVEQNGHTVVTQVGSTTRRFDVSAYDNNFVRRWKNGDVILIGINDSFLYWATSSKRLLLINLDRLDTNSNFVRVNLVD